MKTITPVMSPSIVSDFAENWKEDVFILSGENPAYFPISKKQVTFARKSDADPQNQLLLMIEYLKERYYLSLIDQHQSHLDTRSWKCRSKSNYFHGETFPLQT
jgi:hypothetical protein